VGVRRDYLPNHKRAPSCCKIERSSSFQYSHLFSTFPHFLTSIHVLGWVLSLPISPADPHTVPILLAPPRQHPQTTSTTNYRVCRKMSRRRALFTSGPADKLDHGNSPLYCFTLPLSSKPFRKLPGSYSEAVWQLFGMTATTIGYLISES
jgi:hypothetical protein